MKAGQEPGRDGVASYSSPRQGQPDLPRIIVTLDRSDIREFLAVKQRQLVTIRTTDRFSLAGIRFGPRHTLNAKVMERRVGVLLPEEIVKVRARSRLWTLP